ncbi:MAG: hypothetical protein M1358_23785 [Chloroflexi bacterium]|nr:hypothetical protein [Chloroflexota bacterium]
MVQERIEQEVSSVEKQHGAFAALAAVASALAGASAIEDVLGVALERAKLYSSVARDHAEMQAVINSLGR